jgi:hypothetical protein
MDDLSTKVVKTYAAVASVPGLSDGNLIELCKQSGSPLTFVAGDLALLRVAESEGLRPLGF